MTSVRIKQCFIQINLFCLFASLITTVKCEPINASISLKIEGTGFHRNLMYDIHFDDFIEDCYTALYLRLPSSLYADINELDHLTRLGMSTACASGETNVELFAEKAQTQDITVCAPLTNTKCNVSIPVHHRYQYANGSQKYMHTTLPKPKLLLGCKQRIKEYRVSKLDLCVPCAEIMPKWREIPYAMATEYEWITPVGEEGMWPTVTYTTLLLTILGTLFLIRTICKSTPEQHSKRE
ncbi:uncharacterized protein LOC108622784 [Ceratina calcarata]|uniref:Phosphatidylinositol-glycan biosynthesis class X protein n=1 Tax=Ceratina calcarata TaxID=156304 RepID=A0AAJ7ITW3_9HYME|nr:uncharacterized protein LOC108622784 [Ceratina calcarata]XP_017876355.1 uncharacterized protein LOC108622784 [Ceratina calcarata]